MSHADGNLRHRICPFISSGQYVMYCRGAGCNAARPVLLDGDVTIWICVLIEGARLILPPEEVEILD